MKRTSSAILLNLLWIAILLLTACSPAVVVAPTPTAAKRVENLASQGKSAYPVPRSPNQAYPASGSQDSPAVPALTPMPIGMLPKSPTDAPQPEAGKGSISGVVFSFTTRIVLPKTQFYLTSGWGDKHQDPPLALSGPNKSAGDIVGTTDEQGNIQMNNLPPGDYYLAVWAPLNWAVAVESNVNNKPRLIHVAADGKLPLGVIYVSWP